MTMHFRCGSLLLLALSTPGCAGGAVEPDRASALLLDGIDDYVQVPDHPSLDFGREDFTWELWVRRSRTGVREDILSKKDLNKDSEHDLVIYIEPDDRARFYLRETLSGTGAVVVRSASAVTTGWTHLAAVRSAGRVTRYVNGVPEAESVARYDVSSTGPMRIGSNRLNRAGADAPPVFAFQGLVQEVRVWRKARTAGEIAAQMSRPVRPGEAGLVAYFPLTEGEGRVASDRSPTGLRAELRNGATWSTGSTPLAAR